MIDQPTDSMYYYINGCADDRSSRRRQSIREQAQDGGCHRVGRVRELADTVQLSRTHRAMNILVGAHTLTWPVSGNNIGLSHKSRRQHIGWEPLISTVLY